MRFAREVFNDIWNMLVDFSTFYPGPSKWLGQSRPGSRPPRPGRWPPGPAHTFKSWKGCLLTKHTFISSSFGWLWLARLWETLTRHSSHVANRKWVDFFAPKKIIRRRLSCRRRMKSLLYHITHLWWIFHVRPDEKPAQVSSVALLCILSSGSAMNIYFFPRSMSNDSKMERLTFYFLGTYLIH